MNTLYKTITSVVLLFVVLGITNVLQDGCIALLLILGGLSIIWMNGEKIIDKGVKFTKGEK